MNLSRFFLSILCPPLAVTNKGYESIIIVFIFWVCGWFPVVIATPVILNNLKN